PQAQQQGSIYNVLQTAIHLNKAKFWSEGWGAPHTGLLMEGVSGVSNVSVIQHNLKQSLLEAMK
ncbi:MAG: hypothetical protein WBQ89_23210, partial [Candidatus Acidiferrum sp.]